MAFKLAFWLIATGMCLAILLVVQMPCQISADVVHPAVRKVVRLANTKGGQMALGVVPPGAIPAARMAKYFVR
ncbi:hypothetical protein niasHT_014940 [Heterodera trifolii]|uniref:Uncharacterized protein n=1 Tax=Heterodera trifolii TaxID=157864 RepID=A0ABD2LFN9_9BILA